MSDFEIFPERFSFEERLWSVAEELVEREMAIDVVDGNSLFGDDDVVAWIDLKIGTELIIKMSSERAKQELKQS